MDRNEVRLSDIATIQVGYQARGRIEENLDADFTILRSQDFDENGKLLLDSAMQFSPSTMIDPENYLVDVGDILVQARGQNHLAYIINKPLEKTVASNTFYIVRIQGRERVLSSYLTWWINQTKVQAYFKQERGVSTIPFISKSVLSQAPILVPPLEIQKKICDLIDLWRREQLLSQQLLEKKDVLIQAICRKLAISGKE